MEIRENVSLLDYNTFHINVNSRLFSRITRAEELNNLSKHLSRNDPHLVLGGGSNILFTRDFEGLCLKIEIEGTEIVREDDEHVWIRVGSGVNWHQFVLQVIDRGWGGIENLSLIPGTMGAAPMQNIGAYGVEIREVFKELEFYHIESGEWSTFNTEQCEFGYRNSIFKQALRGKVIITSVTLRLSKHPEVNTSYGAIRDTLEEMGVDKPTIKSVSDAVIRIRSSKLPDPAIIGNAGSFFKNPSIDKIDFEGLKAEFPNIPGYNLENQTVKVPAGWLIEFCGWKGHHRGEVGVHDRQALVLVNHGKGTGTEILELAEEIRRSVADRFGIVLENEVNVI